MHTHTQMSVMSLINAHYNGGESQNAGQDWENRTSRGHQTSQANALPPFFCMCVVSRRNSNLLELKEKKKSPQKKKKKSEQQLLTR